MENRRRNSHEFRCKRVALLPDPRKSVRIRVEPFDGELWWSTSAWSATTGATSSCASGAKIRTNAPAALGRWAERRWQPRDGPIRRSGPEAHRKGEGAGGGDRINVVGTMIRRSEGAFFLKLHGLWEWKRSGHRVPSGSPKGGATATINVLSPCRRRRTRPSTSKNAKGSEAFWTEGSRVQRDRLPEAARRAREAKSTRSPQGSPPGGAGESNDGPD